MISIIKRIIDRWLLLSIDCWIAVDSLDGFNSEAELIKLERCRTIPVSALYDAMRHAEERNRQKLASST